MKNYCSGMKQITMVVLVRICQLSDNNVRIKFGKYQVVAESNINISCLCRSAWLCVRIHQLNMSNVAVLLFSEEHNLDSINIITCIHGI